jgi:serine/threonine-protein kinase
MPSPSLLQRLKERKLVQWALAYLAGAFVVFQLLDALETPLGLTAGIQQAVLVVVGIGFFITLVLAWYHGEKGRQRASGPELLMVAALLVVAAVVLSWVGAEDDAGIADQGRRPDDRPTIGVLPLENLSPNPDYAFFAAGVQEDLTTKLQKVSSLAVISRTSMERYRNPDTRPSLRQIASELGADYLLEGSARVARDSVRITVQLIEGETDLHLWSEEYDAPYSVEDYVRLQAEIVQRIASDLRTAVSPEDREWLEAVPTASLEAYEAFMRGREAFQWERQRGTIGLPFPQAYSFESIECFERAVRSDPGFSVAHAHLALSLSYSERVLPVEIQERTRTQAETALALQPDLPEARVALGRLALRNGQIEEALGHLQAVQAEHPNHSVVSIELGQLHQQVGDLDASLGAFRRAESLDPNNPVIQRGLTRSFMLAHRYDSALQSNAKHRALAQYSNAIYYRAWIHLLRGAPQEARSAISTLLTVAPAAPTRYVPGYPQKVIMRLLTAEERRASLLAYEALFGRGCESAFSCFENARYEDDVGSASRARIYWDSLRLLVDPDTLPRLTAALIYRGTGNKEAALEAAGRAVAEADAVRDTHLGSAYHRFLLATLLAHFGEHDRAVDVLEEILPAPSWLTVHALDLDPIWDPLRSHPRFQALLEVYADDVEH